MAGVSTSPGSLRIDESGFYFFKQITEAAVAGSISLFSVIYTCGDQNLRTRKNNGIISQSVVVFNFDAETRARVCCREPKEETGGQVYFS